MLYCSRARRISSRDLLWVKEGLSPEGITDVSVEQEPPHCARPSLLLDLLLLGIWLGERSLSVALVAGSLQLLLESNSQPFPALGAKLAHAIANKMK